MADLASIEDRAELYAAQEQLNLDQALGRGNDGQVWITNRSSAVKVFYREEVFERERACFRRLLDTNTTQVAGFDVPELINYSYKLLIVEMTVVVPPCVLDFGKAYVDVPPDYSPEVLAETQDNERELFEPEQWKDVLRVRAALRMIGIYYFDARPSNVMFPP